MSGAVWWASGLGLTVAALGWKVWRDRRSAHLQSRDVELARHAVDAALEVLGFASQPTCRGLREARRIGLESLRIHGVFHSATVSLIAFGIAERHLRRPPRPPMAVARLMGCINDAVAAHGETSAAELWVLRAQLLAENPNARELFAQSSRRAFGMRGEARRHDRLRRLVLATALRELARVPDRTAPT